MNEKGKLAESIIGAAVTWILAGVAWIAAHAGLIAVGLAALASIYSIRASRETIKLRKKQQEQLTRGDKQEPDE